MLNLSREDRIKLSNVASLVEVSLGLSLLSKHDCSAVIIDRADREIAAEAPAYALASLLRQANDLLNEMLNEML
mgnify:CR=1 FL=1